MDALRRRKSEVLAHLRRGAVAPNMRYGVRNPRKGHPSDAETAQIAEALTELGYVLLWSTELEDLVAFYNTDKDRRLIPPGFVAYSEQELEELFGSTLDMSLKSLRLIHHAKKLGAEVVGNEEADPE